MAFMLILFFLVFIFFLLLILLFLQLSEQPQVWMAICRGKRQITAVQAGPYFRGR